VVLRRSLGQKVWHERPAIPTAGGPLPRMRVRSDPESADDPTALAGGRFWTAFAALLAIAALPVLRAELPPLFDYPNHLARMYLLLHLGDSAPLQRFYELRWEPVPNLAMDAMVPLLARAMPIAWAGKAFVIATFALLAGGAALLHRAASGGWSLWPLAAFLFLFTRTFLWGFLNYLFGLGLALVAFAAWLALARRPLVARLALSAGFALATYFCHLMACAIYGVLVLGSELERAWRERASGPGPALRRLVLVGLPFLPVLALFLLAPAAGGEVRFGRLDRKLDLLFGVFDNYDRVFDVACFALLALLAILAYGRRLLQIVPGLRGALLLLAAAYLLAPAQIMTASAVDHRLPPALALVLAAATVAPRLGPRAGRAIALGLLAVFVLRIGVIGVVWERAGGVYETLLAALDKVPEGSRLAVAYPADAVNFERVPKTHLPVLAVARRQAFVPTIFAYRGQQPLRLTATGERLAAAAPPDRLWAALIAGAAPPELREFDAVVVLARRPLELPPNPALLPLALEPDFAVYAILR